ncbi:MAG: DedA family protein [Meiothermus sp.]|nr:DedA family protein [Meiothermus sp.]
MHWDLESLIQTVGYLGLFGIVFAETGLLVGFFLPGDTLLFSAGALAAGGKLEIPVVLITLFVASVLGNNVGYWWGKRLGPALERRVRPDYLEKTHAFMNRFGPLAVVLGPFVPIVRTLTPFFCGATGYPWLRFASLNLVGSLLWTQGVTLLGFFLGKLIPPQIMERYLLLAVGTVVVVSLAFTVFETLRHRKAQ